MKKWALFLSLLLIGFVANTQVKPFRFIHISDTHIGSPDGRAEEDLRRTVADINQMNAIAFVVLTGDITELGTNDQLKHAKEILDSLHVKYYIIPGNHDTGWSESGGEGFIETFGDDKFLFDYNGIRFMGCASGPYVRMSDGHIPRSAISWLDTVLNNTSFDKPIIFLNHYPIDSGLDNWYEVTDRLMRYNTIAILCGHGHANKVLNFEGIPGVMGRSNLRAKSEVGGFNIVEVTSDSIIYSERKPGMETLKPWTVLQTNHYTRRTYDQTKKYSRPDYTVNQHYGQVKEKWSISSRSNIISTPAVAGDFVFVGNQQGECVCVSLKTGQQKWIHKAHGSIFSSPAVSHDRVVFGSSDGFVYCLLTKTGKLDWAMKTTAAVLGSPIISGDTIFIGGSDHSFYAINLRNGKTYWRYSDLAGPVVSTPLLYQDNVIFGAWDTNLYAINRADGKLSWQWTNGSSVINYSPAACIPVGSNGVVYVVAPDRFISAIDAVDGKTVWRNNEASVRESIGISIDGNFIYGKTMQDTVVAYHTSRQSQHPAWKLHCGFGYEHVPSMLVEKDGQVFFGTRNGVVYCIDALQPRVVWAHKIDNSMVNTVRVINKQHVIASTMDGKVVLLEVN